MNSVVRILLILFAVAWSGWTVLLYGGQTLGDCADEACFAVRDAEIAALFWRWLAVLLVAVVAYLLQVRATRPDVRVVPGGGVDADPLDHLDRDDLGIINNCLNEVANGVHIADAEFQTRLGVDRAQVKALLERVHARLPRAKGKV